MWRLVIRRAWPGDTGNPSHSPYTRSSRKMMRSAGGLQKRQGVGSELEMAVRSRGLVGYIIYEGMGWRHVEGTLAHCDDWDGVLAWTIARDGSDA
jgi:hypothetical protein